MLAMITTFAIVLAALTPALELQSADFPTGGLIPQRFMAADCGGENRSPELQWSNAPSATKSFALIVHDPDAPLPGGFYHWVVYNIPATTRTLPPNVQLATQQTGQSSRGKTGYYGPCPPPGPSHHYVFTLYALDVSHIAATSSLSDAQLQARMAGHIVARAVLIGMESHH